MGEQWKPVFGFESAYEVSDQGRVRSLPRMRTLLRNDVVRRTVIERQVAVRRKPIVLKPKVNNHGYFEVCLRSDGKQRMAYVQRLVCETFIGPAPHESVQAAHLNNNRRDNRAANLAWTTPAINASHKPQFQNVNVGREKWRRALLPDKRRAVAILRVAGMDDATIARCIDLSLKTIASI